MRTANSDQTVWMPRLIWVFCWEHRTFFWFCHVQAHFMQINKNEQLEGKRPLNLKLARDWARISKWLQLSFWKVIQFSVRRKVPVTGTLYYTSKKKWATTWQKQQTQCAPSEDSDLPSLIRVFAVHMKKAWVLSYPLSAQQIMGGCPGWSVSSLGAQPHCWFCHAVTQIYASKHNILDKYWDITNTDNMYHQQLRIAYYRFIHGVCHGAHIVMHGAFSSNTFHSHDKDLCPCLPEV